MSCRYNDGTKRCRRGTPQSGRCTGITAGQRCKKRRTNLSDKDRLLNVIESDMTQGEGGLNIVKLRKACSDRCLSTEGRRSDLVRRLRQNAASAAKAPQMKASTKKKSYSKKIRAFVMTANSGDNEVAHMIEDDVYRRFVKDVADGKLNAKDAKDIASSIHESIIKNDYIRWYA